MMDLYNLILELVQLSVSPSVGNPGSAPAISTIPSYTTINNDRLTKGAIPFPMSKSVEVKNYSTVTDFARFLGWSTSNPRKAAMW